jgi:REP element-mobilizing transposase RayT
MFITTCTADREPVFANPAYAREAVHSLYRVQCFNPFFLYAFVIMPDHCHFLLQVPEHGSISKIMYAYKRAVCFEVGRAIWQSRFHIRFIQQPEKIMEYIHLNPVRRGLCIEPNHYKWSSASGRWDLSQLPCPF